VFEVELSQPSCLGGGE